VDASRATVQPSFFSWSNMRPTLMWLGGALAFGWALAIVWWAVLSPQAREEITDQLVIPPGTADAIAKGTGFAFVPGQVSLRPGSRLVIVNNDSAEHTVGNAVIPPGAVAELTPSEDGDGFYCSIHPSGFLGVNLTERPPFYSTLVPALAVGLPLGIMAAAAAYIGGRLNLDGDEDPPV
jgi:plastocyanin